MNSFCRWITKCLQLDLADSTDDKKGDALVAFKHTCRDAVPRTVHDKLDETVSPEDFGAVENDPSRATQTTRAINAALSCGKPVSFKQGAIYIVDDTIIFPASGVYHCNHATLRATKDFPEATPLPPGKRPVAQMTNANHCTINNLRIDGNDSAQICLYLSAVITSNCQIKNVYCEKAVLDGIVAEGTQVAAFEGIVSTQNGRHGMLCAEANAMSVIRSRFTWNEGDGVRIQQGIIDGGSGLTTTRGRSSGSVTFYACNFERNAGSGVYNYNTTSPVIVEACWLEGNNRNYATEDPPESNTWVDGTEGYGIRSNGFTIIKDNLITGGANSAGTSLAILLEEKASGDVANNWFATAPGPPGAVHDYVKALGSGCTFSRPNRITDNSTGYILSELDPNAETAKCIPRCVGEELLTNPDFELRTGWEIQQGSPILTWDTTQMHSGTQSLKVEQTTATLGSVRQEVFNTLEPGQLYVAGIWIYLEPNSAPVRLVIGSGEAGRIEITGSWQYIEALFIAKSTRHDMRLENYTRQPATWNMDDATLRPVFQLEMTRGQPFLNCARKYVFKYNEVRSKFVNLG